MKAVGFRERAYGSGCHKIPPLRTQRDEDIDNGQSLFTALLQVKSCLPVLVTDFVTSKQSHA